MFAFQCINRSRHFRYILGRLWWGGVFADTFLCCCAAGGPQAGPQERRAARTTPAA